MEWSIIKAFKGRLKSNPLPFLIYYSYSYIYNLKKQDVYRQKYEEPTYVLYLQKLTIN
jgi:hypothetical protein